MTAFVNISAALIATGSELLSGKTIDSNSAYIAQQLQNIGISVQSIQAVGDSASQIESAVRQATMSGVAVVITTGGLGPTVDDKTRASIAAATGRDLVLDPQLLAQIEQRFATLGHKMSPNNQRQAYLPFGALAMENPVGSAPIFVLPHAGCHIIALPGVPSEMKYLVEHAILPYLRQQYPNLPVLLSETIHTAGIGESDLDVLIGEFEAGINPTVGVSAKPGMVNIHVTAQAANHAAAKALLAPVAAEITRRLGNAVFGRNGADLPQALEQALTQRQRTLASAEAATGGRLAAKLSMLERNCYAGGLVLPRPPVSPNLNDWAVALARQSQNLQKTDFAIGIAQVTQSAIAAQAVAFAVLENETVLYQAQRDYPAQATLACDWAVNTALWQLLQYLVKK